MCTLWSPIFWLAFLFWTTAQLPQYVQTPIYSDYWLLHRALSLQTPFMRCSAIASMRRSGSEHLWSMSMVMMDVQDFGFCPCEGAHQRAYPLPNPSSWDLKVLPIFGCIQRSLSRIQFLTSKISHICQEICDIKSRKKPWSNLANQNSVNTGLDKGLTNPNYTRERDNSNSAKEGSDGGDDWDGTYSSRSTLHPPEPNNPNNPSHRAPIPPFPNPAPSESTLEPPRDLSPSPASRIETLIPSLLV